MKAVTNAARSAANVNAAGQEIRPDSDFNIGSDDCSQKLSELGVRRFLLTPKKYRPPHPMGVKGGCSPQNILGNLWC